jgi:predicted transposase YdaD
VSYRTSRWAEALEEVTLAPNGKEALVALFRDISLVTDQLTVDQLKEAVREAAPQAEETIMTIAEQLTQEGRLEGRLEGRAEGRLEGRASVLQELLEDKFGPLSEEVTVRLQSATEEQASRWTKRILKADSVQAVFGE